MKTKFYFLSLAASVAFAACTNEDLNSINNAEIQKTDLVVLNGIQASVSVNSGVESRIANGAWEATDEVGVGFTNWANGEGSTIGNGREVSFANPFEDGKLYANHRLFRTEGSWKFENVVYEGLHYAYYPLDATHTSVSALTAKVGTEQVYGEEAKFEANGIFAISSLYDLVKTQAGKAPVVDFALNTISNRMKLNLEVADFADIVDPIIVKSVSVVAPNEAFAQTATVNNVPMVSYSNRNQITNNTSAADKATLVAADTKATAEAFNDAFVKYNTALGYNFKGSMSTTVKNHAGFTTAANTYSVNIFSLPMKEYVSDINVVVETNYGVVTISTQDETVGTATEKAIKKHNNEKLAAILKVLNGEEGAAVKFTEREKALAATIKLDMNTSELTEISVANSTEWAAAIKIASQIKNVNALNVTDNVTVDLTNIPANVKTINVADSKTLTISGDVTTEELTITGKVKVAEATALTVNGTIAAPAYLTINGVIENWGDVTVSENGFLSLDQVMNHANVINKNSLSVNNLINHKETKTNATTHNCVGIVKNYATLTINNEFINNSTYYSIGAAAKVYGPSINNEYGVAITEEGGSLNEINGGAKKATVNTPAQMNAAVDARATEITVTGVVSLSATLNVETNVVLKQNAELYILGQYVGNNIGNEAANSYLTITVEGAGAKIKANTVQDIKVLMIKPAATLEILKDSKLNVYSLSYDVQSEITNNGLVYAANIAKNSGLWKGMAANKQVVNGQETALEYQYNME